MASYSKVKKTREDHLQTGEKENIVIATYNQVRTKRHENNQVSVTIDGHLQPGEKEGQIQSSYGHV